MALLITNANFKNTDVTAPQLYARIQYFANADGKRVNAKLIISDNKENALAWNEITTNIPDSLALTLEEGQNQDLATIHEVVKSQLEELGFEVTIDLA